MPLKCPECGNQDTFYREFTAREKIWTDDDGLVAGFKDEVTLEVTKIQCVECHHEGTPEELGYER